MDDLIAHLYAFGVRETIVVLVVLVAVYMLVVVLRMKSLSAPRRGDSRSAAHYEAGLASGKDSLDRFYMTTDRLDAEAPTARAKVSVSLDEPRKEPSSRGPGAQVASFDQEKINRLDRELSATRDELDALRVAFAEVRDELRQEVGRLKAAQRVSPLYADSMQMAIDGATATDITARCGISRAEADLVLALAQGRPAAGEREHAAGGGQSRYGSK